jgi:8-oxo-dGTP diphosphatase
MQAILHGKKGGTSSRGDRVPASVAAKYAKAGTGGDTESKGKEYEGGKWGEKGHTKAKEKTKKERLERKKKKAKLRKSLEKYIKSNERKGAGCLVLSKTGQMLLGRRTDNGLWSTPGGHVEADETHEEGALRELREEAGLVGKEIEETHSAMYRGYDTKQFLVKSFRGKLKNTEEMHEYTWFAPYDLPWDNMTDYCRDGIAAAIQMKLKKNKELPFLLAEEELQKNIIRSGDAPGDTIYEVTHGDSLRLIGNGTFRMLREAVQDMTDEDHREIGFDNYKISIRKHVNDVYSGRIVDGHKQVHQWTNKSLPAVAAELMSVFEWYLPEDEKELEILDEDSLTDDVIAGGLGELIDKYRKHNIVNIYSEMENIREEMRHGMAVDLQQVEQKIMKLFDKLESTLLDVANKHNVLNNDSGDAIDMLEHKLLELQTKIEGMGRQPTTVDAYSSAPGNDKEIHGTYYPYLSKPSVTISPSGHIKISFDSDWTHMERGNFLSDMKAKAVKKSKK